MIIGRNTTFLGRLCCPFWVIVEITFVLGIVLSIVLENLGSNPICTSSLNLSVQCHMQYNGWNTEASEKLRFQYLIKYFFPNDCDILNIFHISNSL